jgi:hypothetical protein
MRCASKGLLVIAALPLTIFVPINSLSQEPGRSREKKSESKIAAPSSKPAFLVQSYLQLPTTDSITVMWETTVKLPSRVEFGATRDLGRVVEAASPVSLHEIALYGLETGTKYYYRVRSGELASDIFSFKTAPPAGTNRWRMAVYGDSRSNPTGHRKVAEQIAKAHVDLIVHTGDIVANGKNHESWRTEFFEPLAPLAGSTPWVSTIGNHERDSENYFSYMALPGNERYFGFDYANAHIICLDSNGWIEKGRDSQQLQWLQAHLKRKRAADWTFVAFHHPLFSAHATRPINALRWDWAPVFIDPANRVDAVLTGHDHFYARNYLMGRVGEEPRQGVLFLTSAGGGANLYRTKPRDYIAKTVETHHFTLFEFDGDRINVTAIDSNGAVIDSFVLTKNPTPADEYCAYEIEELRQNLRLALASAPTVPVSNEKVSKISTALEVPTRFAVAVKGQIVFEPAKGWNWKHAMIPIELKPGAPLRIPIEAEVEAGELPHTPSVAIEFEPGRFSNRKITFYSSKLAGPTEVVAKRFPKPGDAGTNGEGISSFLKKLKHYGLIGLPPRGGRMDNVALGAIGEDWLAFGGHFTADSRSVPAKESLTLRDGGRLVLQREHVRLVLSDGRQTRVFAVSPDQTRFSSGESKDESPVNWHARISPDSAGTGWIVEMAVPLKAFPDLKDVRMNVVHRAKVDRGYNDFELCPTYGMGDDADLIPDWKPVDRIDRFARLKIE